MSHKGLEEIFFCGHLSTTNHVVLEQETAKHRVKSECPGQKPTIDLDRACDSLSICTDSLPKESPRHLGSPNKPQLFQDGEIIATCPLTSSRRLSFGTPPLFSY